MAHKWSAVSRRAPAFNKAMANAKFIAMVAMTLMATVAQAQTGIPQGSNEERADFFAKCAANSDLTAQYLAKTDVPAADAEKKAIAIENLKKAQKLSVFMADYYLKPPAAKEVDDATKAIAQKKIDAATQTYVNVIRADPNRAQIILQPDYKRCDAVLIEISKILKQGESHVHSRQ